MSPAPQALDALRARRVSKEMNGPSIAARPTGSGAQCARWARATTTITPWLLAAVVALAVILSLARGHLTGAIHFRPSESGEPIAHGAATGGSLPGMKAKDRIIIVGAALTLAASSAAHAQQQVAAHFVSPAFSTDPYVGPNALSGITYNNGRLYAAIGAELHWFHPGSAGWNLVDQAIGAPDIDCLRFGQSLAGDGTTLVAGSESGHLYFFDTSASPPTLVATWRAPEGRAAQALRMIGDTVLVGLPSQTTDAPAGTPSGGALLRRVGQVIEVTATFSGTGVAPEIGRFGDFSDRFVVLSGERPSWFREAHTMTWQQQDGNWVYRGEPTPTNPTGLAIFGQPSVIEGDILAVGARDDDQAGWQSGACFIFRWSGAAWQQEAKVVLQEAPFNQQEFGQQLAIRDGKVYASAPGYMGTGSGERGRVYVISSHIGGWAVEQKLRAPDTGLPTTWGLGAKFGPGGSIFFMGLDRTTSASWRNIITAYALPTDCNANSIQDARELIESPNGDLNRNGVPDTCECAGNPGLCCSADINQDGSVDGGDIGGLLYAWGDNPILPAADIDRNGSVDGFDLAILLASWGPCSQ